MICTEKHVNVMNRYSSISRSTRAKYVFSFSSSFTASVCFPFVVVFDRYETELSPHVAGSGYNSKPAILSIFLQYIPHVCLIVGPV